MKMNINILSLLSGNESHFTTPQLSWSLEVLFSCTLLLKACCPGKADKANSNGLPPTLPAALSRNTANSQSH